MKEHETFQSGVNGEIDGIVINNLLKKRIFTEINGGDYIVIDFQFGDSSKLVGLTQKELDAMIGFLTFVRSKMG